MSGGDVSLVIPSVQRGWRAWRAWARTRPLSVLKRDEGATE